MIGEKGTAATTVRAEFAGKARDFRLRIGEIGELERICGAGIGAIMMRLATHQFYAGDVWETLRLGLEGGGAGEIEASALLRRYREGPLAPYLELAGRIIAAAVEGIDSAKAGEGKAAPSTPGDFAALYRTGGMMGLDPRRVDDLTIAEFRAMVEGFAAFHGGEKSDVTRDDYEAVLAEEMAAGRA